MKNQNIHSDILEHNELQKLEYSEEDSKIQRNQLSNQCLVSKFRCIIEKLKKLNRSYNDLNVIAFKFFNKLNSDLIGNQTFAEFVFMDSTEKMKIQLKTYLAMKSNYNLLSRLKKNKNQVPISILKLKIRKTILSKAFKLDAILKRLTKIQLKRDDTLSKIEGIIEEILKSAMNSKLGASNAHIQMLTNQISLLFKELTELQLELQSQRRKHLYMNKEILFSGIDKTLKENLNYLQKMYLKDSDDQKNLKHFLQLEFINQVLYAKMDLNESMKFVQQKFIEITEQESVKKEDLKIECKVEENITNINQYLQNPIIMGVPIYQINYVPVPLYPASVYHHLLWESNK